ncbi:MAG: DUF3997 domain-containing protein [Muribaculaceae bacterium]|nr:DUF3997 domain-containing protein [Muribaculaceae bacterium]
MRFSKLLSAAFLVFTLSSCMVRDYEDFGDGYCWCDGRIHHESANNKVIVNTHSSNHNYNSTYIVAEQIPNERYFESDLDVYYAPEIRDSVRREFEKEKAMGVCYWIINKKTHQVYGPLTKEDYVHKRDSLKVKLWLWLD